MVGFHDLRDQSFHIRLGFRGKIALHIQTSHRHAQQAVDGFVGIALDRLGALAAHALRIPLLPAVVGILAKIARESAEQPDAQVLLDGFQVLRGIEPAHRLQPFRFLQHEAVRTRQAHAGKHAHDGIAPRLARQLIGAPGVVGDLAEVVAGLRGNAEAMDCHLPFELEGQIHRLARLFRFVARLAEQPREVAVICRLHALALRGHGTVFVGIGKREGVATHIDHVVAAILLIGEDPVACKVARIAMRLVAQVAGKRFHGIDCLDVA